MIDKTLVIIPTYNEAGNIRPLIESISASKIDADLLFVDDNSPDGTADIVRSIQSQYQRIQLLVRENKGGIASAYIEGFTYALNNGYTHIVQMDADLSHDPRDLERIIQACSNSDIAIGSRYVRHGGVSDWPIGRKLLSRCANILAQVVLCMPISDSTSGFKCFHSRVLIAIDYTSIIAKGYAFQIEMAHRCYYSNLQIVEVPIIFRGRINEQSKISSHIVFEAILRLLCMSFFTIGILGQRLVQKMFSSLVRKSSQSEESVRSSS